MWPSQLWLACVLWPGGLHAGKEKHILMCGQSKTGSWHHGELYSRLLLSGQYGQRVAWRRLDLWCWHCSHVPAIKAEMGGGKGGAGGESSRRRYKSLLLLPSLPSIANIWQTNQLSALNILSVSIVM